MCKQLPDNSHKKSIVIAKGDSGASHHYIRQQDQHCLTDIKPNSSARVTLPNAKAISSTKQGNLNLHKSLTSKATNAVILPQLQSSSLVSLGQLCDDDCQVHLHKKDMKVHKNKKFSDERIQEPKRWIMGHTTTANSNQQQS